MSVSRVVSFAVFVVALLATLPASAAIAFGGGYPQRSNTSRVPSTTPFDITAANAGINRADCFDTTQEWRFTFLNIPTDAVTVEIWARADETSCDDPTQRAGTGATTPACFKVASWPRAAVATAQVVTIKPVQIIQAIDKRTNVDDPSTLDPNVVCQHTADMPPSKVVLQILALKNTTDTSKELDGTTSTSLGWTTLYDLAGPNPPTNVTLGAGNTLVVAHFDNIATTSTDFHGFRAYCFPNGGSTTPSSTTKGIDGGLDDAATDADATAIDTGALPLDDSGAASDGATTTDTGTVSNARPAGCPAGDPFVVGTIPTPALDKYICGELGSVGTASAMTIDSRTNLQPYAVAIAAFDHQGNSGALSNVACATPKETNDFYGTYRRAGGTAGGGWCAYSGGAAPFGVGGSVMLLALVARLSRRAQSRRSR